MKDKVIICIGRQIGSEGCSIGRLLSELMNIPFYDKELLVLAAKESGLNEAFFEKVDEKAARGLSYAFTVSLPYVGTFSPYTDILSNLSNDGLFKVQSDVIRHLAQKESCIIAGRCADYILREMPEMRSVFIYCSISDRIQNLLSRHKDMTEEQAAELIAKTDKTRSAYYSYYTDKIWGDAPSYNLSIDSSILGVDGTAQMIKHFIESSNQSKG
jgi:hypothetical protein